MGCSGATQFDGKLTWLITGGKLEQKAAFFWPGVPPGCVASADKGEPVQFSARFPGAVGQMRSSEAVQPSAARGHGGRLPNSTLSASWPAGLCSSSRSPLCLNDLLNSPATGT